MPINAAWHRAHRMPPRATELQRAQWHLEHTKHCDCRPIPPRLVARMRELGVVPPGA